MNIKHVNEAKVGDWVTVRAKVSEVDPNTEDDGRRLRIGINGIHMWMPDILITSIERIDPPMKVGDRVWFQDVGAGGFDTRYATIIAIVGQNAWVEIKGVDEWRKNRVIQITALHKDRNP